MLGPQIGKGSQMSRQKIVCPLGKPFCDPRCKYFDPRTKKCKLIAKKTGECITC